MSWMSAWAQRGRPRLASALASALGFGLTLTLVVALAGCSSLFGGQQGANALFQGILPLGVTMSSVNDGWVVGEPIGFNARHGGALATNAMEGAVERGAAGAASGQNYAFHYRNGAWSRVPMPDGIVRKTVILAPNDVWAIGNSILHYDGYAWSRAPYTYPTEAIGAPADIAMDTATDGWVVGSNLLLQYHNGQWSDQRALAPAGRLDLRAVFLVSATDGWAVGLRGVILHYDGHRWTPVAANPFATETATSYSEMTALWMDSATDGWGVGVIHNADGSGNSVILHYTQGRWSVTQALSQGLRAIQMVSASDGWIGGSATTTKTIDQGSAVTTISDSFMLRYQGGRWTPTLLPSVGYLSSLSFDSATDGWAVGDGALIHYQNGVWSQPIH